MSLVIMYNLKQHQEILIHRLEKKGIARNLIPGFLKILTSSLLPDSQMGLPQVNKRLQYLGWEDFELDYHTLQLAKACLEDVDFNMANLSSC
jgi:hypothetical protein